MRGIGVALLVMGCGCGGAQGTGVAPETYEARANPASPERAQWWSAGPDACPDDAVIAGRPPPAGDEVFCQRPNGSKHGRWTWWADSGAKLSEGEYRDDLPEGEWVVFYENGNRKTQGSYEGGRQVGRWYGWDEDGNLTTDVTMVTGQRHGPWTWYHPNGRKAGEGEFLRDQPHGIWTRWDELGQITKVEEYDNDRLVRSVDYENGAPVAQAPAP